MEGNRVLLDIVICFVDRTRPEIAPYLETINDLLGTGSSEEKSNKAKSVKSTVLGSATEKILDLVKEKGTTGTTRRCYSFKCN